MSFLLVVRTNSYESPTYVSDPVGCNVLATPDIHHRCRYSTSRWGSGEKEDNIGFNVDFDTNADNESIVFPFHPIALSSQEREIF